MAINQLSIFLENKPGSLVEVTDALGKAGIDIRAMSLADTQDFGILRLIVGDASSAKEKLAAANFVVSVTQVIGVALSDKPGALSDVTRLLFSNGINVEYMYAFLTSRGHTAYVVLRVNDNDRAANLLKENGIELISESNIKTL